MVIKNPIWENTSFFEESFWKTQHLWFDIMSSSHTRELGNPLVENFINAFEQTNKNENLLRGGDYS